MGLTSHNLDLLEKPKVNQIGGGQVQEKQDGEMDDAANTRLNFLKSYLNQMESQTVSSAINSFDN